MQYFPNNTVAQFITKLENAISLSGDWEVGLVEIQYQHSWSNLIKNEGRILYSQLLYPPPTDGKKAVQSILRVPPGYYETAADIVQVLNEFGLASKFKYSPITRRLNASMDKGASLHFTPQLSSMLGISARQNPIVNDTDAPMQWRSSHVCDVSRRFSALYVYCSVLEHIPVGDTKAPLLRIVNVSGKSGDIVHVIYDRPLYVPLQQRNFDNVEIDIRSDTGEVIPFEFGKSVVTLHFRRCKIPYLLQ